MSRHYYNFTSCIQCKNIEVIKKEIIELLEYEGGTKISHLPNSRHQSLKYWIVGLFPTNCGWTIIKTFSPELLCCQTIDIYELRLTELATQLNCSAFHLSVYDNIYGILLETNAIGEIYISGCYHPNFQTETFYNQIIDKPGLIEKFYLLEIPNTLKNAIQVNRDLEIQNQLEDKILLTGHTQRIDLALSKVMGNTSEWYFNLLHQPKFPSAKNNLLYFCPPANYKIPIPYKEVRENITIEQFLEE